MLKWTAVLAALATIFFAASPGLAASGTALGVDPDAQAELGSDTRTLVVGSDIFIGDRVITGPEGQVQIVFSDNTELVVGPRSAFLIEDYLLRDDGSAGKFAINALSGTFRFVTGRAPKDSYEITTPAGTIGVRGTAFELFIADLYAYVLMQHGAVVLRPENGAEVELDDKCEYGFMGPDGAQVVGNTDDVKGDDREKLKEIFLFVLKQSSLLAKFRIDGAERCLRRPVETNVPESLVKGGSENAPTTPTTPPTYNNNSIRGLGLL